ncbi:HAD-like protein [Melanomma pulvis-pyrius CBS 109.77]|uniref:HAD-like protein n=1 Tax=Melanomma pulvis-pyrius CBS 109.77 TaxID=1314802 RepID=A0A6A6XG36_9PLEO|nr:HAD-like protein [Melanomma pulvis-pyrius CBS 109.77]
MATKQHEYGLPTQSSKPTPPPSTATNPPTHPPDKYEPFSSVTRNALSHALAESSATLAPADMDALMAAYDTLSLFPDAGPLLAHLESAPHIHPVIFSNGTAAMIAGSLAQSADLAPHAHVFRQVVVVEPVERFKPCAEVYRYLCGEVGKRGREGEVWLVSSNPFDVVGAKAVGIRTCWVDRSGVGWADRLVVGSEGRPDLVVKGLDEVVGGIEGWMGT